ncbi:MAG TPA: hypothetical protein VFV05_16325 [Methylomirabilota bacterium]|nr:hypothetical protein [Methylomirabilota bacterium]
MAIRVLDARGVALPMALMSLALLGPLMLAFAALSVTEPIIAGNHLRASQARALADSGLEYALWALSTPAGLGGLPSPLPATPAAAPFDGRTLVQLGITGGFTVQVANHAAGDPQVRTITSVGWADGGRAHRQVVAEAVAIPRPGVGAPCALCVRGALTVSGNVAIDGVNRDPACGDDDKSGTFTRDATTVSGPASITGGAGGLAEYRPSEAFDAVTLSPAALDALRALALRAGTYYGPGFPNGGLVSDGSVSWPGRPVFGASNPLPDGVVFIDATDGRTLEPGGATTTLAGARLEEGAFASPDGTFRGWIVVNGALEIVAGLRIRGLVYAADSLTYRAPGPGAIEGLAVALNARDAASRVETTAGGGMSITFDCAAVSGTGVVPRGFVLIPGTYREEHD